MSFCGEVLKENQNISEWRSQLREILNILEKENIYHNDMHRENFVVENNKLFLIDFGCATINKEDYPFKNIKSSALEANIRLSDLWA